METSSCSPFGCGMDYEIYPLAITQVEWRVFIDVCQRVLGYSPTRGLDATHLDIKDPAAFLGSFDMDNEPLKALRDQTNLGHQHFSISFLAVVDLEGVVALFNTSLKLYAKTGLRKKIIVIITGSMDQWYQSVVKGCREEASYELRWLMNRALARFEQAGFREIFSHFKKQKLADDTFILKT